MVPGGPGGCLGKEGAASIGASPEASSPEDSSSLFSLGKISIRLITVTKKKIIPEERRGKKESSVKSKYIQNDVMNSAHPSKIIL